MSDDRPIADRMEGVPTPTEHDLLVGHDGPMAAFHDALAGGRMHHAWMLAGPRGIGKATAAYRMAAEVLGGDEGVRRQIAAGGHPGLLTLARPWDEKAKRFRTQLPVEEVRRTQPFFGFTAGGGERRVCIVDAADDMNASSANALLKILEEPPAQSLFLVVAHAPGRLLPTIRSRCRTLHFAPLVAPDVARVMSELTPDVDGTALDQAVAASGGAPRTAFDVAQGEVLKHFSAFQTLVQRQREGRGVTGDMHVLAERVAGRGGDFDAFLDLVFGWMGERVREEARESEGGARSLVRWAALWEEAREARERAATYNLDRKQVVLDILALLFEHDRPVAA